MTRAAVKVKPLRAARLLCLLAAFPWVLSGGVSRAQEPAAQAPTDFRSLLLESGFSEGDFEAFSAWNGELDEAQASLAARLLFRMEQADDPPIQSKLTRLQGSEPGDATNLEKANVGQLVVVEGTAISAEPVPLPTSAHEAIGRRHLTRVDLQLDDGSLAAIISLQVPNAWMARADDLPLSEPARLQGVLLVSAGAADESRPLLLARHIEWRPAEGVSSGVAWLARQGFDVALLDEVRHDQPFAKAGESREAEAFYKCLAVVAAANPAELARVAVAGLPAAIRTARSAEAEAARKRTALSLQLDAAAPAEQRALQVELKRVRGQEMMAQQIIKQAQQGRSSVWRTFLDPEQATGDALLIEGTARRAVRIIVDDGGVSDGARQDAAAEPSGNRQAPREYYELDVFTSDLQNPPTICCVARLPAGFPTGEVIREPVRVAGIFFKKWAYVRRMDEDSGRSLPQRIAPPLLLAAEPEWLRPVESSGPDRRGLWAGIAFAGLLALLWIVLARTSRRDRLAKAQQARYHSGLDSLSEPLEP